MKRIYVSGSMSPSPKNYRAYSIDLLDALDGHGYEISVSLHKPNNRFIVHHDLARLKRSDIVVINLGVSDTSHHMTGCVVELFEANRLNIPVYAFVGDGLLRSEQADSPWMEQFITFEFDSFNELINYLICDENI